jgi:LytS/YehU family sensor histidine kinase
VDVTQIASFHPGGMTDLTERGADPLAWRTWPGAIRLILSGRTRHPALRVGLVVGTLLTLVNQGTVLVAGHVSIALVLRIVANYAIPYVVSSIGLLSAHREV